MQRNLSAVVLLLVFAASPAAQVRCLFSCEPSDPAPTAGSCHRESSPGQAITQGDECSSGAAAQWMTPRVPREGQHLTLASARPFDSVSPSIASGRPARLFVDSHPSLFNVPIPLRI